MEFHKAKSVPPTAYINVEEYMFLWYVNKLYGSSYSMKLLGTKNIKEAEASEKNLWKNIKL